LSKLFWKEDKNKWTFVSKLIEFYLSYWYIWCLIAFIFTLGHVESPPEPAPNANQSSPGLGQRRAGRARLGFLESECESEPPYLPTMISDPLLPYNSRGMKWKIGTIFHFNQKQLLLDLALCEHYFILLMNQFCHKIHISRVYYYYSFTWLQNMKKFLKREIKFHNFIFFITEIVGYSKCNLDNGSSTVTLEAQDNRTNIANNKFGKNENER
jgi:hypothetical protein